MYVANISRCTSAMFAIVLGACASTGSTFRSGVGDSFLASAPYYAGRHSAEVLASNARIGHLPVVYQRGATHGALFDPPHSEGVRSLLADMNSWLQSSGRTRPVPGDSTDTMRESRVPPDVFFGCKTGGAQGEECQERGDSALGRGIQTMLLTVARPSAEWISWTRTSMVDAGVDAVLVLTFEIGNYFVVQKGLTGRKEVQLGTGRTVPLPWLSSLETPVSVVQLTGSLVGRDGKAIRIGAEGLMARRTPLLASAVGAQRLISDADIAELRTLRRSDLPGDPLAWQVALRTLVDQLAGTAGEAR